MSIFKFIECAMTSLSLGFGLQKFCIYIGKSEKKRSLEDLVIPISILTWPSDPVIVMRSEC